MDSYVVIILISSLLIISYVFSLASRVTNIPSVLMLMGLGVIVKVFVQHDLDNLQSYLGILGNVGLILIVLEASLDLNLEKDKVPDILKALLSAIICIVGTSIVISFIIHLMYGVGYLQSTLYAIPFSVISSAIVIPSVQNVFPKAKEFVIYESSMSDIIGIILFYLFLELNQSDEAGHFIVGATITNVILTIVIAFVLSYILIWVFTKIKDDTKLFLIISSLILLYGVGKLFHLSSLIIIVIFGMILKNQSLFFTGFLKKWHAKKESVKLLKELHHITLESVFVIKTFFFFLFGFYIDTQDLFDVSGIIIAILFMVGTYAFRYLTLKTIKVENAGFITTITPRGLISILLFFTIPVALHIEGFGNTPMLVTIIITNVVMTIGLVSHAKKAVAPIEPILDVTASEDDLSPTSTEPESVD